MTNRLNETLEQRIDGLIGALDSIHDGERAVDMLISCGKSAIPRLADFLLNTGPSTIALPRCRAVRALGELGSYPTLIDYFKRYVRPQDAAVLLAEDAVRSAAARELARYPSAETFKVLLGAAWQRATAGLILALSEFHRLESVPLFFEVLEDDLCREDAMNSLRRLPDAVRQFGMLTIRGLTNATIEGPSAVCRRRATLQLLSEVGVTSQDWLELRRFLAAEDPAAVLATAKIGLSIANEGEWPSVIFALFKVAVYFNSLQEEEAEELLDSHPRVALTTALQIAGKKQNAGERPNWLSPLWRILNHTMGRTLETTQHYAS